MLASENPLPIGVRSIVLRTVPAPGATLHGSGDSVIARVRTTLSLRPSGRTVGGEDPAARGSTGCTLNLDESKRSILSKLSSISTIFLQAPRCWQDY